MSTGACSKCVYIKQLCSSSECGFALPHSVCLSSRVLHLLKLHTHASKHVKFGGVKIGLAAHSSTVLFQHAIQHNTLSTVCLHSSQRLSANRLSCASADTSDCVLHLIRAIYIVCYVKWHHCVVHQATARPTYSDYWACQ